MKKLIIIAVACLIGYKLIANSKESSEKWMCKIDGNVMYSISSSGKLGGAQKGCSCSQIRNFELKQFGKVDEQALKSDFGC